MVGVWGGEGQIPGGPCRLGGVAMAPMASQEEAADLPLSAHVMNDLRGKAGLPEDLPRVFQFHNPKSDAKLLIVRRGSLDPVSHLLSRAGAGIVLHGDRIRKNVPARVDVL